MFSPVVKLLLMVVALGSAVALRCCDRRQKTRDPPRIVCEVLITARWWRMPPLGIPLMNTYSAPKIKQAYGGGDPVSYGEQMGGETHVGWGARNYHPGTAAGDQTDYGEATMFFDIGVFTPQRSNPHPFNVQESTWKPAGYKLKQWICTQTKNAYQQVAQAEYQPINLEVQGSSVCTCL
jgi:hypothetical protein